MGKLLGAYDSDELDRPDLNKCPECGCFFATDTCTLCGKLCPEEMRAGNRAKVKPPKKKRSSAGRVQFIPWYHQWWFMLLISFFAPYIGIVLFITSPYSKRTKIIVSAVAVAWFVVSYTGILPRVIDAIFYESPVNDNLSRAEYTERCTEMTADEFYRHAVNEGDYVTMELTVVGQLPSSWFYDTEETIYYRCRSADGKTDVVIIDCILEDRQLLRSGDMIRVWGESAGMMDVYPNYERIETLPGLYTAYCDLIG